MAKVEFCTYLLGTLDFFGYYSPRLQPASQLALFPPPLFLRFAYFLV